jgi:hypothetical protein
MRKGRFRVVVVKFLTIMILYLKPKLSFNERRYVRYVYTRVRPLFSSILYSHEFVTFLLSKYDWSSFFVILIEFAFNSMCRLRTLIV